MDCLRFSLLWYDKSGHFQFFQTIAYNISYHTKAVLNDKLAWREKGKGHLREDWTTGRERRPEWCGGISAFFGAQFSTSETCRWSWTVLLSSEILWWWESSFTVTQKVSHSLGTVLISAAHWTLYKVCKFHSQFWFVLYVAFISFRTNS